MNVLDTKLMKYLSFPDVEVEKVEFSNKKKY